MAGEESFEGPPPENSRNIHIHGQANGQGRVYLLGQGIQNITYNHYANPAVGRQGIAPLSLLDLRLWIDRIAADYRRLASADPERFSKKSNANHTKQFDAWKRSVALRPKLIGGKDVLRRLLAGGVAQYLTSADQLPRELIPEQVVLDVVVFALWPIIETPQLPETWRDDLSELTSLRIVQLVAEAREVKSVHGAVNVESFARAVAAKSFTRGVLNLLDDLNDPRRGGAALAPIIYATGLPQPQRGAKAMLGWVFVGALGGAAVVATTQIKELLDEVWEWISTELAPSPLTGSGAGDPSEFLGGHVGSGSSRNQGGAHSYMIDDIVDHLF